MPQNSTIAFALLVGFIVFITMRGELTSYLQVIGLAGGTTTSTAALTATAGPQTYTPGLTSPLLQPGLVTPPIIPT